MSLLAQVVVDIVYSADIPYSYRIPPFLAGDISVGDLVRVPFGRSEKLVRALVLALSEDDGEKRKEIREKTSVSVSEREMALIRFLKNRYFCTFFDAFRLVRPDQHTGAGTPLYERNIELCQSGFLESHPEKKYEKQRKIVAFLEKNGASPVGFLLLETGVSRSVIATLEKNGVVRTVMRQRSRSPVVLRQDDRTVSENLLNSEQEQAYKKIVSQLGSGKTHLLYGVTGSGKTHVFIALINEVLARGQSVIVMIPEISLTYQLVGRLYAHYGKSIAVLHSGLSKGEKADEWQRIEAGEARIVIGTRSAVFSPVKNLGLLIMDEEQEHTYKSEMTPRYHAREVAAFLAGREKALLLLASATPSFESYLRAQEGIIGFSQLKTRYNRQPLPKILTVDLQREVRSGNRSIFSRFLISEIEKNRENNEQTILFMNRRGYHSYIACPVCRTVLKCPNCGIPLTYHLDSDRLMCHYCSYSRDSSSVCPGCGAQTMRYTGVGTQKAEEELKQYFPELRVLRMDADTVTGKNTRNDMLTDFGKRRYDVLLGTQMITKGLDFPDVTLVGVLNADSLLYSSDFRAYERTFSLLTQVAGRAGRSEKSGRAVIQTYSPTHEVLKYAFEQDYPGFFENQASLRKNLLYPPYCDLCQAVFIAKDEPAALLAAETFIRIIKDLVSGEFKKIGVKVILPRITFVPMVDGKSRSRILIKCKDNAETRRMLHIALLAFLKEKTQKDALITLDMNPASIL